MRQPLLLVVVIITFLAPSLSSAQPTKPDAPQDVYDLINQANAKSRAKEWPEAVALLERVVQLNPTQGNYWYSLGTAHYYAKDFKGAIAPYERALQLGSPLMGPSYSAYQIACCYALDGQREQAIAALDRALSMGFPSLKKAIEDEDFASIRDDARVKKWLGLDDVSKMSREEGWRYDLELLAREVHRKGFRVRRDVTPEQFDAKLREISDAISKRTDGQIIIEMMKLMVFLHDGHTSVWDEPGNAFFSAALPVRLYWFEEGLFVTAADPTLKDLVGAQIVAFDGRPAAEVLEATAPLINRDRANGIKTRLSAPYTVRNLKILHTLGLIKNDDRVTLTVRDLAGATRDVVVAADTKHPDIWNELPAPPEWITFASTLTNVPLYLRDVNTAQWFEYLSSDKAVYFQFNKIHNGEKETIGQFGERLLKFIDEHDVEKLVIDLRWNNGGDTSLAHPFLLKLIANQKINQRGKLFVIIGRRTYSAAQNTATFFERFTNTIFVGEPTGSCPNFVGEEVPVTLPYSKLMANVSHLEWQSSWPQDQRSWLAPSIYVPPTFEDMRAGRDGPLEAILKYEHRPPNAPSR